MSDEIEPDAERQPLNLTTEIDGVTLRELAPADAPAWIDVVNRNREHLTEFGDYTLPPHTVEDASRWFTSPRELDLRMGIWRGDELMGYVGVSHLSRTFGGERLMGYRLKVEQ